MKELNKLKNESNKMMRKATEKCLQNAEKLLIALQVQSAQTEKMQEEILIEIKETERLIESLKADLQKTEEPEEPANDNNS
jgi:hypothetical protein